MNNLDGVFPHFFNKAVILKGETEKKGYPVAQDQEWVTIHIAGDNKTVQERKVTDADKKRWPSIYAQFKQTGENKIEGFPVKEWPLLTASQVEKLHFISVYTVEQLAGLDDNGLAAFGPGGRGLQTKAKAFLNKADKAEGYAKLAKENDELKTTVQSLQDQIKELEKKFKK